MHSGTHYMCDVLGLSPGVDTFHPGENKEGHLYVHTRFEDAINLSKKHKTVVPLRHPGFIAVSWKKRGTAKRKHLSLWDQWSRLDEAEGFFFPIENKPFDELEDYVGFPVNRKVGVVASVGDYAEKKNVDTAKKYLGKDWELVEQMLSTDVGKRYY